MDVVTQNCGRGIGGKAVWANRKGVSKKSEEVTLFRNGR
jgi:hypothetical protein